MLGNGELARYANCVPVSTTTTGVLTTTTLPSSGERQTGTASIAYRSRQTYLDDGEHNVPVTFFYTKISFKERNVTGYLGRDFLSRR